MPSSVGSIWSLAKTANQGFVIFAGCMMGIGAAFLRGTQGAIVASYPLESERSRYFSYQYFLTTLGASIGGFVALADTIMHDRIARVSDGT
jgi:MFS family permease